MGYCTAKAKGERRKVGAMKHKRWAWGLLGLGVVLGGLAWAQGGFGLSGKLLGYRGQAAEVWATLDASGDPDAAVRVGSVQQDGRFVLELPAVVPEEMLSAPQIREDCGEVTLGLKLAVLTEVYVQNKQGILGTGIFANRRAGLGQLLSGQLEGSSKVGFWFYANRAGKIIENCDSPEIQQISNVSFKQGWNEVTGFFIAGQDKPRTRIQNGHTAGLMRWFFLSEGQ
jgi:hypothetical protein